jgi:hypothetical protein
MKVKTLVLAGGIILGVSAYAATLRLRTYLEIANSLETATNVSSDRPEILSFYENRKNLLPQKGEFAELNEQSTIVSTGLGALYCTKMIEKDSQQTDVTKRWSHRKVLFDQAPAQGLLSDAILADLFTDYSSLFWQRSATADEVAQLTKFAQSLASDLPTEAASTPKILLGLCSVFSGSFSANSF